MHKLYGGLPNFGAKAHFLFEELSAKGQNFVFVTREEEDLDVFDAAFSTWGGSCVMLPPGGAALAAALYAALSRPAAVVALTYDNLNLSLPYKKEFLKQIFTVEHGMTLRRGELTDMLSARGYERVDFVENEGEFAIRGSVVDIFTLTEEMPLRLYFSGNTLSSINAFDVETQNTTSSKGSAVVVPVKFDDKPQTLKDWFKGHTFVFDSPTEDFDFRDYENILALTSLPVGDDLHLASPVKFNANTELLKREISDLKNKNYKTTVFCLNRGELDRITEMFDSAGVLGGIEFKIAPITQGFYDNARRLAFITSSDILNRAYHTGALIKKFDLEGTKRVHFKDLSVGDYIVHQTYGIGRYSGLELIGDGVPVECLIIEFRRGSKLFVPVHDFGRVQKYIGVKGKAPALSSLGGNTWKEVKARVRENARENAEEILKLEAARAASLAPALEGDAVMEREFADSFPYPETPDQTKAIEEILSDLVRQTPTERVLVGDVGFGKTEVAMRAALRAAASGYQTIVLVPTTILAAQHYKTFSKRMAGFKINIAMLSRFQTAAEQRAVVQDLVKGNVDIVIGTHRLLSKDVGFKNLGLCIIDEEHRFGVKQKDRIKKMSKNVHTLLLSATPIPRTLNQSLSSLKDLSIIQTPPQGRMPIKTVVMAWDNDVAAQAVRAELARGGQVFYVYNRVQTMASRYEFLKTLVPEAKICMAHGQMKEDELEEKLWDFYNKKYDILLASTIIESGLDVTNANTLIVEAAQDFGLAQLYQLRGRIGRGDKKAYCYLFHPDWLFKKPEKEDKALHYNYEEFFAPKKRAPSPTEEAQKRLSALSEFSALGSGFKLALRDLEIRGAGQILGVRQHGFASEVGVSMYLDMLSREVKKLKGVPAEREINTTVNVPFPAFIPPDYLPDDNERLRFYKDLMGALADKQDGVLKRLEDLSGPAPAELRTLARVTRLAALGARVKARHIEITPKFMEVFFTKEFKLKDGALGALMAEYGSSLKFLPSPRGDGMRFDYPAAALKETEIFAFVFAAVSFLTKVLK